MCSGSDVVPFDKIHGSIYSNQMASLKWTTHVNYGQLAGWLI